jgi:hypothetical protein
MIVTIILSSGAPTQKIERYFMICEVGKKKRETTSMKDAIWKKL